MADFRRERYINPNRDITNAIDTARLEAKEEGRLEGIEQGIEQGIQQGIEQGIQQGLEQGLRQSKVEIARNLKSLGLFVEQIVTATGLTITEIEQL